MSLSEAEDTHWLLMRVVLDARLIMEGNKVFVTVGTTHFDALVEAMAAETTLEKLCEKGYTNLILQIGSGKFVPEEGICKGVNVTYFRLKPSITQYFAEADLVISHAGAGSCLEALAAGKPLVTVINETLMGNHQTELAEELAEKGFCLFCYPSTLRDTLANLDVSRLKKYEPGQPERLVNYLDSVIKNVP